MKIGQVYRIDVPFVPLLVVAFLKIFANRPMLIRRRKRFVSGKKRWLAWSHIDEDQSRCLLAGVGEMAHGVILAAVGLAWLLQTASLNIIEPTVIETAQTPIFYSTITQVSPTVRTVKPQQSGAALIVSKEN